MTSLSEDRPSASLGTILSEPGESKDRATRVAVILLNYPDAPRGDLAACVASLDAQRYPSDRWTLFIVNNGVSEEERRQAQRLAPRARLLDNERNLGWGAGNNRAVRVAVEEGFDCCVMLNIDVVAEPDWLARLVEAAEQRPDVQILQSKILLHGTTRVNSLGNRIQFLGFGYCYGYGREDAACRPLASVDYASGAAMLVKRRVFERVGLFREEYFMYYDDVEFCWRARVAGCRIGLAVSSVCYHKYSFQARLRFLYHLERNRLLTLLTLEKIGTILLTAPCLIAAQIVLAGYCLITRRGGVPWGVLRYFLRAETLRSIAARRRTIRSLRTVTDAAIVKRFGARVVFAEVDSPILRYVGNPLLWLYWRVARLFIVW